MLDSLTVHDVKSHIAELSRTLRKYESISQDQLADRLDMSRITIQNLERPKNVTLDTFLKVLQHFDLLEKFDGFIVENIEDPSRNNLHILPIFSFNFHIEKPLNMVIFAAFSI